MNKYDRWMIVTIIVSLLISILGYIKYKSKPIIFDISWIFKDEGYLDLSWYDEEPSQIYSIYISNESGINIRDKNSYTHVFRVSSLLRNKHFTAKIPVSYEWVYFVISKNGYTSNEYEAHVRPFIKFNIENLEPKIMSFNKDSKTKTVKLNVLPNAEIYRIYLYKNDDEVEQIDYNVKDEKTVMIKIDSTEESVGYISGIFFGVEEKSIFFFLNEKVFLRNKWKVRTRIS